MTLILEKFNFTFESCPDCGAKPIKFDDSPSGIPRYTNDIYGKGVAKIQISYILECNRRYQYVDIFTSGKSSNQHISQPTTDCLTRQLDQAKNTDRNADKLGTIDDIIHDKGDYSS